MVNPIIFDLYIFKRLVLVAVLKTGQEEIAWGQARCRVIHEKAVTVTRVSGPRGRQCR